MQYDASKIGALVGCSIADVERALILETLQSCFGNRTRAANVLRISIRTLRNKINKYTTEGFYVPVAFQMKGDGTLSPDALSRLS
jgi:two-component system, response regulator FlrC